MPDEHRQREDSDHEKVSEPEIVVVLYPFLPTHWMFKRVVEKIVGEQEGKLRNQERAQANESSQNLGLDIKLQRLTSPPQASRRR